MAPATRTHVPILFFTPAPLWVGWPEANSNGGVAMFRAYKRYTDFQGRSGRKEFWLFTLWLFIGGCATAFVDLTAFGWESEFTPLAGLFCLASFIPSLSVHFRRLHDINRTAWWILIGLIPIIGTIVLIVFGCTKGDPGDNRFGPPDSGEAATKPVGTVA